MPTQPDDSKPNRVPAFTPAPPIDAAQEVRFAVVMYGGVSLAIYINGVTQELLRMVRATAPAVHDKAEGRPLPLDSAAPKGTEWVYRKLSYLLGDESLLNDYRQQLTSAENSGHKVSADADLVDEEVRKGTPIRTRFLVDILSGTSAGGINAIYLAKALANDQSIDELKKLWVNEGDIALLINDKGSVAGLHLKKQNPPLSLLNSRRMYLKLLAAFDDMDGNNRLRKVKSPYIDELDLFITTTDIEGVPLQLQLSDAIVYERRHRNVFHFKYATEAATGGDRNDFTPGHNPFLAFAARCTSSFPFAFEPMRLCDIDEVLDLFPHYRHDENCKSSSAKWQRYFIERINPDTDVENLRFPKRSFGDGGYLDNKPFTYTTETLTRRQSSVPVDRKLIYIEPSPEHPEDQPQRAEKPDALQNAKAALTDLPTYETIREDLQRLLDRNRLINRVTRLTAAIEKDIAQYETLPTRNKETARPRLAEGEWDTLDLAGMIDKYGVYYLPYRRLRIADATDQMTELIAYIANFDAESDQFTAVRCLVRAWRERTYTDYHTDGKKIVNNFLNDYDFSYRLRRLNYVRGKIDVLHCLDALPVLAGEVDAVASESGKPNVNATAVRLSKDQESLLNRLRDFGIDYLRLDVAGRDEFRRLRRLVKCEMNEVFVQLRAGGRQIRKPVKVTAAADAKIEEKAKSDSSKATFAEKIGSLGLTNDHLKYLLGVDWSDAQTADTGAETQAAANGFNDPCAQNLYTKLDDACVARGSKLLENPGAFNLPADLEQRFNDAAATLKDQLDDVLKPASKRSRELLNPQKDFRGFSGSCRNLFGAQEPDAALLKSLRTYLWNYYSHFDDYDQISFPVLYETGVAESDVVEVIRISPEDAKSLIDEREEHRKSSDGQGRRKLAGTALHNFGAFLDRAWRQNDIMWGRLDGAERLITSLLPGSNNEIVRRKLVREAQNAIFIEELPPESRRELGNLMSNALVRAGTGEGVGKAVEQVIKGLKDSSPIQTRLENVMRASLADEELIVLMSADYEVNRQLDPQDMLRVLSRSTQVIGKMFEEIANSNRLDGNRLRWIARLGQIFWGLIEVAVPHSILNRLVFHWLKLLYVFEVVLLITAIPFGSNEVQKFALTLFGVTATINITVLLLRDMMRLKRGWLRMFITVFVMTVLLLAGFGAYQLFNLGLRERFVARTQNILNKFR